MAQEHNQVEDLPINTQGQRCGTSRYLLPNPAGFVAEAKIGDYCRCCPCSFCPTCPLCCDCVSDEMVKRTYARVYENRVEINYAYTYLALCCCCACSTKSCVRDQVVTWFFDMPPTSAWSAPFPFCCLQCTCCGPPAVAAYTPKCCCFKCGGQTLFAGPCAIKCFFGLCGDSCFPCSAPFLNPVIQGENFLSAWKAAYESYADHRGIPRSERARFYTATDGCCGFNVQEIPNNMWDQEKAKGLVEMMQMERE